MCELELRLIKLPYELGRELAIHVGGNTQNLGGLKFEPLPGSDRLYDDHVCLQDVSNLGKGSFSVPVCQSVEVVGLD